MFTTEVVTTVRLAYQRWINGAFITSQTPHGFVSDGLETIRVLNVTIIHYALVTRSRTNRLFFRPFRKVFSSLEKTILAH
jgi:hypothetical protein